MNNRYKTKKVGHSVHVVDTYNYNRMVQSFDKSESEEANNLCEKLNIQNEIKELEKQLAA